jgi:hypothetical protein
MLLLLLFATLDSFDAFGSVRPTRARERRRERERERERAGRRESTVCSRYNKWSVGERVMIRWKRTDKLLCRPSCVRAAAFVNERWSKHKIDCSFCCDIYVMVRLVIVTVHISGRCLVCFGAN